MTETSAAPSKSTRRTVLRAGATAAWTIPAVQVATMIPAFAVSHAAVLSITAQTITFSGDTVSGSITIKNTGTVTSSVITVSFSNLATKVGTGGTYAAKTATGWSFGSGWGGSNGTAVSTAGLAGGASTTLTFSANLPTGTAGSTTYGRLSYAAAISSPGTGTAGSWTDVLWAQPALVVTGTPTMTLSGGVATALITFKNTGGSPSSTVTVTVSNLKSWKNGSPAAVGNPLWTLDSSSTGTWNAFSPASATTSSAISKLGVAAGQTVQIKFTAAHIQSSDTHASLTFSADITNTAGTDVANQALATP